VNYPYSAAKTIAIVISITLFTVLSYGCSSGPKEKIREKAINYAKRQVDIGDLSIGFDPVEQGSSRARGILKGRVENRGKEDLYDLAVSYRFTFKKRNFSREGVVDVGELNAGESKMIEEKIGSVSGFGNYSTLILIESAAWGPDDYEDEDKG